MAQAIWSGSLTFGLVNIPVRLYNATAPKDVRFRQFQGGTGRKVRYRRVAEEAPPDLSAPAPPLSEESTGAPPVSEETRAEAPVSSAEDGGAPEPVRPAKREEVEVPYEQIVKGYEVDRDRYVMVSRQELEALAPEQNRTIEIEDFVDLQEIDPVYFEKSYFLAPQMGLGAERPYWLLLRAMERAGKVGIARFVLRTREYLAAIRPTTGLLGLETLFYSDEVREPREIRLPAEVTPSPRELDMAGQFIDALATAWEPTRYRDTYRERVLDLVRSKAGEATIVEPAAEEVPSRIPDLMAALKASVEAARKEREARPGRRTG